MSTINVLRSAALTALAAVLCLAATPSQAKAQDFLEFLFGGFAQTEQRPPQAGRPHVVRFYREIDPGQIIVSFADRKLYYIHATGRAIAYPIATPRRGDAWQGVLTISKKTLNPTWTPTPEMRRENPRLPAAVQGGDPRNPLGTHALYLGSTLYRIHGTDAPWTIGQPVSRGCIRMHNAHVADLFNRVSVGTTVTVTYRSYAQATQPGYYW